MTMVRVCKFWYELTWYELTDSSYQNNIQSNLSYVTFQGNIEIGSPKTGGHLIQVKLMYNAL
jgi:hypothetical protein